MKMPFRFHVGLSRTTPKTNNMPKAPEAPIVFFLRVPPDEPTLPPAAPQKYSEILEAEETSRVAERFSPEVMKSILEKTQRPT